MSGIEIIAIAASVIQIADAGARLSNKLFVFTRKVKSADRAIQDISHEIAATGAALRELGEALEQEKYTSLGSRQSVDQTSQIVADCWKVFTDINETIGGDKLVKGEEVTDEKVSTTIGKFKQPSFSFKQRIKFPFIEPQINQLRSKLESLKSSLVLMLQVLLLAEQVRNRPKAQIPEDQKALIKTLVEEKNAKDLEFRRSCRAIENVPTEKPVLEKIDTDNQALVEQASTAEVTSLKTTELDVDAAAPRSVPVLEANVGLTAEPPAPKPSISPRPPLKWSSSRSSLMSGSETLENSSADLSMPPALRIRDEEIQHHAMLVHNLLQEISDVQYRIDHGIRHRMHDGVLKIHWDEWAPFATKYGHDHFHRAFEQHKHVVRYWLDLQEGTKAAPLVLAPPAKKMIHFRDTIGRTFSFPYEKCRRWADMVESVSHTFEHDVLMKDQITAGQFDLFTEEGNIILPRFWDVIVEPDMKISMEIRRGLARVTSKVVTPHHHHPPPVRPYHQDNASFSTFRWRSRGSSSESSRLPIIRRASPSSPRSPRPRILKHAVASSSDDSDDGLFDIPVLDKAHQTLKPTLQPETPWSQPQVAQYLANNWFSQEWVTAFQILGLEGEKFVALGSPSGSETLHYMVYPELEMLFSRGGKSWTHDSIRQEGMRLRRLIINMKRAPVQTYIDRPQKTIAGPAFQVSDETLDLLDDASQRFKPLENGVLDQGQIDLLRDQIFAFKELCKYGSLSDKLQEHLKLPTTRDSVQAHSVGVDPQLVTGDQGLLDPDQYIRYGPGPKAQAQYSSHDAYIPIHSNCYGTAFVEGEDDLWDEGKCPRPDCGKVVRDLKAHMLIHEAERSEECPITSCKYHRTGFTRTYDRIRHLLTHFTGRIICPFCPGFFMSSENVLSSVHIFSRHLVTMHRVKLVSGKRRSTEQADESTKKDVRCPSSTCDETFHSAQAVFEHLEECICLSLLQQMDRQRPVLAINETRRLPFSFGQPENPAHGVDDSSEDDEAGSKTPPEIVVEAEWVKRMNDLAKTIKAEVQQQHRDVQELGPKSEIVGSSVAIDRKRLNKIGDAPHPWGRQVVSDSKLRGHYVPGGDSFGPSTYIQENGQGPDLKFVETNVEFGVKNAADSSEDDFDSDQDKTNTWEARSGGEWQSENEISALESQLDEAAFDFGEDPPSYPSLSSDTDEKQSPTSESTKRTRPIKDRDERVEHLLAKRKRLAELKESRERRSQPHALLPAALLEDDENTTKWGSKTFEPVLFGEALKIQDSIISQGTGISFNDVPLREKFDSSSALMVSPTVETSEEAYKTDIAVEVGMDRLSTSNKIWDQLQSSEKFHNGKRDIDNLISELRVKAHTTPGASVVDENAENGKKIEANTAAQPSLTDLENRKQHFTITRTVLKRSQSANRFVPTPRAADSSELDLYHAHAVHAETTGIVPAFMPSGRRSRSQDATTKATKQVASFMTLGLDFPSRDLSPAGDRQLSPGYLNEKSEKMDEVGTRTDKASSTENKPELIDGNSSTSPSRQQYQARVDSASDSDATEKAVDNDTREEILTYETTAYEQTRRFVSPWDTMERRRQRELQDVVDNKQQEELNPPTQAARRQPANGRERSWSISREDPYAESYSPFTRENLQPPSQRQRDEHRQPYYYRPPAYSGPNTETVSAQYIPPRSHMEGSLEPRSQQQDAYQRSASPASDDISHFFQGPSAYSNEAVQPRRKRVNRRRYIDLSPPPPRSTREDYDAPIASRGFGIRNKPVISHDRNYYVGSRQGDVKTHRIVRPDGTVTETDNRNADYIPPAPLSPAEWSTQATSFDAYGDHLFEPLSRRDRQHERRRRRRNRALFGSDDDSEYERPMPEVGHADSEGEEGDEHGDRDGDNEHTSGSARGTPNGFETATGTGEGLYDLLSQYTTLREDEIVSVAPGY